MDVALAALAAVVAAIGAVTQFTVANNVSAQDVTDLIFDSTLVKSFEVKFMVYRESTGGGANIKACRGSLLGCFNGTIWEIVEGAATPTDAGVTFDIDTTTGQIKYTADNQAGTYQASTSVMNYMSTTL